MQQTLFRKYNLGCDSMARLSSMYLWLCSKALRTDNGKQKSKLGMRKRGFAKRKEGTRGQLTGEKGSTVNDWWDRAFGCICQAKKWTNPSFSLPEAHRTTLIGSSGILEVSLQWPLLKMQWWNFCQTGTFPSAAFMLLLILVPVALPLSRTCPFIHLSSNAHSLLCHFPWWPPTLSSVIFSADFSSFMLQPDYPFLPLSPLIYLLSFFPLSRPRVTPVGGECSCRL